MSAPRLWLHGSPSSTVALAPKDARPSQALADVRTSLRLLPGIAIRFQFRVGRDGRDGADGFALVLHRDPAGLNAQGLPGAQLGYGGIRNRFAPPS